MQIVVLANEDQKAELLPGVLPGADVQWHEELDALAAHPPVAALIDLLFDGSAERLSALRSKAGLVLVNSVEKISADSQAVRFNGWPGFLSGPLLEAHGPEELHAAAEEVLRAFQKKIEWLPDRQGLVTARVVSTIINEACQALEEGVSSEEEIDTAMKLGTNYPYGPFEWAQKIGRPAIYSLLEKMSADEPRYQPAKNLLG